MVTSTSVPASSPVASSGMMTYPSAAVSTDSSADSPNTGVATPPVTRTWTTSRRPVADGRSRASRARTTGSGGGIVQPPTRCTSGTPSSRKTTSADRGLPGSPMTGTPAHSASSVGLPGRIARPWHQIPGGPRRRTTPAVSSRTPTEEPAEITIRSLVASAARSAVSRASAIVGHDAARDRLAARLGHHRGERDRGRVPDLPRAQRRHLRRHHLVPGGEDRHPRAGVHGHRGDAGRGQHGQVLGAQRPAAHELGPLGGVLVGPHDALAGRTGRTTSMVPGMTCWVYSTMTTASAPGGSTPPVGMLTAVPAPTVTARLGAHQHGAGHLEVAGQALGDAVGIRRPHRVPVHGRAGEAGQRVRRGDRPGRHPVQGVGHRHRLGGRAAGRDGSRPAPAPRSGW